ncbi:rRNA-binding ribosome biosynthesis protein UTP25 Ecym_3331 [Eremothecium cymbalariae DBVPG|uniref:U3 small nucleolar RNA-associated protein 25 n=1 Tax=Eremothecium cymbalariae (strain CBS 270.75 / DBVPG 7215 / KCTC 17166 / NRRL Y-17582) TaxID=931890 RepID=G8JRQ2_ERECY|nr:Hypothetical protein Ecym_3331 [Eremothecium cymbalariae DBVPG\
MDSKRGRKQLRKITRIGRNRSEDKANGSALEKRGNNDGDEYAEIAMGEHEKAADDDQEERTAHVYGALLSILNSAHPEIRRKRVKVEKTTDAVVEERKNGSRNYETDEVATISASLDDSVDKDEEVEEDDGVYSDGEDSEDERDPFEYHFNQISEMDTNKLDAAFKEKTVQYESTKLPYMHDNEGFIFSKPVIEGLKGSDAVNDTPVCKGNIHSYFMKKKLKVHNGLLDDKKKPLTPLSKTLVDPIFQYRDLLFEYEDFSQETEYRDLYTLHILNHIYKTRDRILKNNHKLQENDDQELLDQGFTRPKVLVVAPTRNTAYDIIEKIIDKSGLDQVDKKSKFKDQFYEDSLPPTSKPKSFQHVFKGNTNDFFVLGMKFTRKTLKLYSNFYQSDVIVCSPLGIQLILENTDKKKRQDDFLSSIEMLVVDQLHSLEFQNPAHVLSIFQHINKIPQKQHDSDFSRIRMWYINDQARLFRQTLIFTKYVSPFANSLINGKCCNWSGRFKNRRYISPEKSAINQLGLKVRQVFHRFDLFTGSSVDEPDYRFKFFTSVTVPIIQKSTGYEDGILLYIPDYTDFLRVRNYFKDQTRILFGEITEYSDQRQVTSNRALFQQGKVKVLLYTERLHHFRRYQIKGVKSVIFYKPPSNPEFYQELIRCIGKNAFLGNADLNISTVRCTYCKLDSLSLERIVGSKRAAVLTRSQNEIYEFK